MKPEQSLARRLAAWFGLDLARGGRLDALERVIDQRARWVKAASADEYVAGLRSPDDAEVALLLETVTVGHTWFFRDAEQVDAIGRALRKASKDASRPAVWVAGCSTGEDAYTVALVAAGAGLDADVLGTDINPRALDRARAGRYAAWSTRQVPPAYAGLFTGAAEDAVAVDAKLASTVRFEHRNLLGPAPVPPARRGGWDVILCRNVLIYFERAAAADTVERLCRALVPGGLLFLGASEVIRTAPIGCAVTSIGSRVAIVRLSEAEPKPAPAASSPPLAEPRAAAEDPVALALRRLEAGESEAAIMACAELLEADPLRADAHLVSGMAFHLAKDPEPAVRALSAAVLLDPQLWPAFFYLGQALDALDRHAEAADAYRRASLHAEVAPSGKLGVLEAYREEMVALAKQRSLRAD